MERDENHILSKIKKINFIYKGLHFIYLEVKDQKHF